jgi:hypothetical protein
MRAAKSRRLSRPAASILSPLLAAQARPHQIPLPSPRRASTDPPHNPAAAWGDVPDAAAAVAGRRPASPHSSDSDRARPEDARPPAAVAPAGRTRLEMLAAVSSMDARPPRTSPPRTSPPRTSAPSQHHRPWSPVDAPSRARPAAAAPGGDEERDAARRSDDGAAAAREADWGPRRGPSGGWRPGPDLLVDGGPPGPRPRSPRCDGGGAPGGGGELPPEAGPGQPGREK